MTVDGQGTSTTLFTLHVRKESLHKQKQKKRQQAITTIQCMEAGLFISQVKYRTQRRILFGLGLLVQELD